MIVGVWRLLHSNCTHALTDPYAPPLPSNPSAAEAGKLLPAAGSRSGDLSSCSEPPLESPDDDRPRRTSQPGRHPHPRRAIHGAASGADGEDSSELRSGRKFQPGGAEPSLREMVISLKKKHHSRCGSLVGWYRRAVACVRASERHFGHPSTYPRLTARGLTFAFLLLRIDDGDCRPRLRKSCHRCVLSAVLRHACQWLYSHARSRVRLLARAGYSAYSMGVFRPKDGLVKYRDFDPHRVCLANMPLT